MQFEKIKCWIEEWYNGPKIIGLNEASKETETLKDDIAKDYCKMNMQIHWTAKVFRKVIYFINEEWKFLLSTIVSVLSLIVAIMALWKS